jgi:hypothetical protein
VNGPRRFEHRDEIGIFGAFTLLLVGGGVVYLLWTGGEPAGTALLVLAGACTGIIGGYLAVAARATARGQERGGGGGHEQDATADEPFLPHASVWPLELGAGTTLTLVGLMLGRPVLVVGALVTSHALWGWARQSRRRH